MCKRTAAGLWTGLLFAGVLAGTADLSGEGKAPLGLGRRATEAEMRAWDRDVSPTGEGLPAGKGQAQEGARLFSTKCASCHGATGTEGPAPRLAGGRNTLATKNPVKTVGSYWPYATTLYDYIRRAMPFTAPQSLTSDDVYAVTAWILARNGIITDNAVMDAQTLPNVRMPNRDGFVPDPRPDVPHR